MRPLKRAQGRSLHPSAQTPHLRTALHCIKLAASIRNPGGLHHLVCRPHKSLRRRIAGAGLPIVQGREPERQHTSRITTRPELIIKLALKGGGLLPIFSRSASSATLLSGPVRDCYETLWSYPAPAGGLAKLHQIPRYRRYPATDPRIVGLVKLEAGPAGFFALRLDDAYDGSFVLRRCFQSFNFVVTDMWKFSQYCLRHSSVP
jgi:hypothetical protein